MVWNRGVKGQSSLVLSLAATRWHGWCHVGKPIGCLAKVERRNSVVVGVVKDLGPDLPTPLLVLMRGKERRRRKEGKVERGGIEKFIRVSNTVNYCFIAFHDRT